MSRRRGIENDLLFARQGTIVEEMIGWQDYNDLATQTTPIDIAQANTWYQITNDGLGPFTTQEFKVLGKPKVWDADSNQFNFQDLFVGGILWFRFAGFITCPSANTETMFRMRAAVGSPSEYTLPISGRYLKRGNFKYQVISNLMMTLDNQDTVDYPSVLEFQSDVGGVEVEVSGWKIITLDRY